jgi:hypothetical protein
MSCLRLSGVDYFVSWVWWFILYDLYCIALRFPFVYALNFLMDDEYVMDLIALS